MSGGNVLNLENVLRDPRYSNVNFVLLHGGYPFQNQAIWLAARENVYLDSSLMGLYLYPADLAEVLRRWLLLYPDKVVFGSDAFPFNEAIGAEESDWLAIESARKALAAALVADDPQRGSERAAGTCVCARLSSRQCSTDLSSTLAMSVACEVQQTATTNDPNESKSASVHPANLCRLSPGRIGPFRWITKNDWSDDTIGLWKSQLELG